MYMVFQNVREELFPGLYTFLVRMLIFYFCSTLALQIQLFKS